MQMWQKEEAAFMDDRVAVRPGDISFYIFPKGSADGAKPNQTGTAGIAYTVNPDIYIG